MVCWTHQFLSQVLCAKGRPSRADRAIAAGVAESLTEIKQCSLHCTCIGRVANNTLLSSALRKVDEMAVPKAEVAAALNRSVSGLVQAQKRFSDKSICDLMDPTREERKDALSVADLQFVQCAWEVFTEPAPDYVVNHFLGDGMYVTKPVHWKKHSGEEIYDKVFISPDGKMHIINNTYHYCCLVAGECLL